MSAPLRPTYEAELEVEVARLTAAMAEANSARWQAETRLASSVAKAREEGHEEVLAFIRNGRFLGFDAPPARFAIEIEAGWKTRGKAAASRARSQS